MNNQQKTENIENILSNNSEEMPTQYNNRMENQVPGESDIKRASEIDDEDEGMILKKYFILQIL